MIFLVLLLNAKPLNGYLFPKYIYSKTKDRTQRIVEGVADAPMANDDIDRIFKGGSTKLVKDKLVLNKAGGIRGIASETEPAIVQYSFQDIKDTCTSNCETLEQK